MSAQETIEVFLEQNTQELADIIVKYPQQIPVKVVAEFMGCGQNSLRQAIMQGVPFGIGWIQHAKQNRGFCIPTGAFVRWYMGWKVVNRDGRNL